MKGQKKMSYSYTMTLKVTTPILKKMYWDTSDTSMGMSLTLAIYDLSSRRSINCVHVGIDDILVLENGIVY